MSNMRVMVVKYGFANVKADTEKDAVELTKSMQDSEFDWSDFGSAEVVESDIDL